MPGLLAAQDALREWMVPMRYFPVLGLVLIEDAPGKMPKPLREMKRLVASGAPHHWDLPYLNSLRLGGNALELNESALVGLGRLLGGALERHVNL